MPNSDINARIRAFGRRGTITQRGAQSPASRWMNARLRRAAGLPEPQADAPSPAAPGGGDELPPDPPKSMNEQIRAAAGKRTVSP